jgi:lysophospholipase L1-like esterase
MRFRAHCILFLVTIASLQASPANEPPFTEVSATDARIVYMGRTERAGEQVRMGFPGVTIRFVYRGPAPVLKLSGDTPNCFFNLSCNGWDPVLVHLKQGANEIALPTGVAPADGWQIELVRRTESWMGAASFDGLLLPPGCEMLPAPPMPQRRLMFIGDSITCAEYDERFPPENDDTPRSTNAARSYGMLLGRWLGAQVHLVCYGGRGITRDWSGKTDTNTVPVFFSRAMPDEAKSSWNPARYQPDVIVINVGTDLDSGLPDAAGFADAYAAFVGQVRAAHPRAFILLCDSAYQSNGTDGRSRSERDFLIRTLNTVAERRRAAGDKQLRVVLTGFYPGTPTNSHIVAFQQEQLALDLLGPIRKATGW